MSKIQITLDVSKFDKTRIKAVSFTAKDGSEVKKQEYKVELIPLKDKKFVHKGADYKMFKTHFVVQAQTPEERKAKAKSVFVGDGFEFEKLESEKSSFDNDTIDYGDEDININDIPF